MSEEKNTNIENVEVEEKEASQSIKSVRAKNRTKIYHNKPVPQPPEDSDSTENDVKVYKKNHTEYEYMTVDDFNDWRDEHKVKVVANVKPWQKYKEKRKDNKKKGCLDAELVINKDDDNSYRYNLYKNSNQKAKGYIYVGEYNFIRMEKRPPIILWIIIGLLLLGCLLFGIKSCMNNTPFVPDGNKGSGIVVDNTGKAKTEYYWIDNLKGTYTVTSAQPNVPLNGARENETVYLKYTVVDTKNHVLKETGLIKPGYVVQWDAASQLSKGTHKVKFIVDTYDANQKHPDQYHLGSTTISTEVLCK